MKEVGRRGFLSALGISGNLKRELSYQEVKEREMENFPQPKRGASLNHGLHSSTFYIFKDFCLHNF